MPESKNTSSNTLLDRIDKRISGVLRCILFYLLCRDLMCPNKTIKKLAEKAELNAEETEEVRIPATKDRRPAHDNQGEV